MQPPLYSFTARYRPVVALIILVFLCSPVPAHSAAGMGVSPDQFDTGIPVYWPFHAILMSAGLVLLVAGMVVMRYHRTSNWYRAHKIIQSSGAVAVIAGLSIAIGMVSLSGIPHLVSLHGNLGAFTIALLLITLAIGFLIIGPSGKKGPMPPVHRWGGRIGTVLVVVNIILGLSMMGVVLAQ